jgi:hypothetical protein
MLFTFFRGGGAGGGERGKKKTRQQTASHEQKVESTSRILLHFLDPFFKKKVKKKGNKWIHSIVFLLDA